MARIDALPSLEIIRGLKGILDFYLWKGLPCVRAWPTWRPARQSAASKNAALLFGAIIKAYSLLGEGALEAYREDALDQTRTARDIMVTGVYGNLHEANMSDFLDLLTQCRDFLSNLTALLNALDSIDTDELVVNVDQTVLPPTAAIDAHQLTQIAALQKLDDLQDALQSKALDRLLVRGMDQLFSLDQLEAHTRAGIISGPDGVHDSHPVPAGKYWIITNIMTNDSTTPTTRHEFNLFHNGSSYLFGHERHAFAPGENSEWHGHVFLDPGDTLRAQYFGGLAGDTCWISVTGYQMTLET